VKKSTARPDLAPALPPASEETIRARPHSVDLIVSGDAGLLILKQFHGMPFVTPYEAVTRSAV
jgi:hypothetical protein